MRMKGLEPSLLSELEPKSSASANSATSASVFYSSITNYGWQEVIPIQNSKFKIQNSKLGILVIGSWKKDQREK